jgi:hypothetical protein
LERCHAAPRSNLTSLERQRVLDQATQEGNDYHLQKSSVKTTPLEGEAKDPRILTGSQAVPRMDPRWDPQSKAKTPFHSLHH